MKRELSKTFDVIVVGGGPRRAQCSAYPRPMSPGALRTIVFANGEPLPRQAIFFNTGERQRSPLIAKLGCELDEKGRAETSDFQESNVSGLYIVGDASGDIQFAIVAAAEGREPPWRSIRPCSVKPR